MNGRGTGNRPEGKAGSEPEKDDWNDDDSQIHYFGRVDTGGRAAPTDRTGQSGQQNRQADRFNRSGSRQQSDGNRNQYNRARDQRGERYQQGGNRNQRGDSRQAPNVKPGHRDASKRNPGQGKASRNPSSDHQQKHGPRRQHAFNRSSQSRSGSHRHKVKRTPGTTLLKAIVSYQWGSRSLALRAIHDGRVTLNNEPWLQPNQFVRLEQDIIAVDGQVLQRKSIKPLTIVFHKPKGLSGSREDGRESLYSFLSNRRSWFTPAGVLPASASGIVIVSNDRRHRNPATSVIGKLTQDLWVKVAGVVDQDRLDGFPTPVRIGQRNARCTWLAFEGTMVRLRDLAVQLKSRGLEVLAWERRRLGPFTTATMHPGVWYRLDDQQVVSLDELVESGIPDSTPLDDVWEVIAARVREAR